MLNRKLSSFVIFFSYILLFQFQFYDFIVHFFAFRFVFCFYQIFFVMIIFNNCKNFNNTFLNNKRLFSTIEQVDCYTKFRNHFRIQIFRLFTIENQQFIQKKFDEIIKKIIRMIIITNQRFFEIIFVIKNRKHSSLILSTYSNN